MTIRTWNGQITPPDGVSADSITLSVTYVDSYFTGGMSNPEFFPGTNLIKGNAQPDGSFSLSFDDADIPQYVPLDGTGEPFMMLVIMEGPINAWLFGPYDRDGNPS